MNERTKRILEAGAVHAVQQAIGTAFEKAKARIDGQANLRKRIETLEAEVAELKAAVTELKKRRGRT
jgi:uncharacterized protein YceH (UPF0502 family)